MKKVLFFIIAIIAIIIIYNKTRNNHEGDNHYANEIRNYKGVIQDIKGNTLTLTSGVKVQMLGVKDGRTDVEMFVTSKYIGKTVLLIPDSDKEQVIPSSDATVRAYVNLEEDGTCLNHIIVNEYRDAHTPIELTDSTWTFDGGSQIPKSNLALYMKQRTFLIVTEQGVGTGFFINENGLALTNWHVLNPNQEKSAIAILYQNDPDDSDMYTDKKRNIKNVLWSSDISGMDITVFSVDLENGETVPFFDLAKRHAAQGDRCATFGNPGGSEGVRTATYTSGDLSAYRTLDERPGLMMVQYTTATNPGNSGGPVCDIYGQIIAVHEMGDKSMQNTNYGIDILPVREELDRLNLKYGGK